MKLTAEQRLERTHVKLMQHKDFCLFAGVFMIGKVEVREDIPTACTNGRDVAYGRAFVESLDDKQLAFLVLHEAMHKAYRHISVWQHVAKVDPRLVNMAMDYVINLQIQDQDKHETTVAMPRDADGDVIGCIDEEFRGMDTKQVYDILKQKQNEGGHSDSPSDGRGNGQPTDGDAGFDEHDWDGAKEMTDKEKEELSKEIDSALREGSILAGKMSGNIPRGIDELLHPKVDWREALREFIKTHTRGADQSTWRRPHRKYLACDMILPSSESHKAETFVIGVDTSGSIGGEAIAQFLGEVKCIADEVVPECIELLYWDSSVAKHETYRDAEVGNLVNATKPSGGGGTEPACVPAYMDEHRITPQCVIMLTDGYFGGSGCGDWSMCAAPVLWCVVGNSSFVPTVGQSVFVE
jgi:predicted metal-dependent peptidase